MMVGMGWMDIDYVGASKIWWEASNKKFACQDV